MKGAEIAREEDLKSMAVSQYGYALLVALKKDRFFYEPNLTRLLNMAMHWMMTN